MSMTHSHLDLSRARLSFPHVVNSEWIKFRTIRSTLWCYAIIILLTVGFGLLAAAAIPSADSSTEAAQQTTVAVSTIGVSFSQLVIAVLGVLIVSGEYSTGMIRSTFAAVPKRLPAIFAKIVVLGVVTFVVGLVSIWLTAVVTLPILSGRGLSANLGDSAVFMPLLGGGVYLMLVAVLAFSIGTILRSTAGGIASAVGLLLVLPIIVNIVGALTRAVWITNVGAFLPSSAGGQLYAYAAPASPANPANPVSSGAIDLNGWSGLIVMLAWVVVGVIAACVLVKRRDA
jgi:ABC-2 type transport system permease protein